jgi:protein-S-isoprenylcysteine O-methyltransferase Ste14
MVILGVAIIAVGLALGGFEFKAMRNAGVSPDPRKPPERLVVNGPFRFTRNPIYVSFSLMYLRISVAFNALWPISFLILALILVDRGVISREKRVLERRFGEHYRSYKSRVRRWM